MQPFCRTARAREKLIWNHSGPAPGAVHKSNPARRHRLRLGGSVLALWSMADSCSFRGALTSPQTPPLPSDGRRRGTADGHELFHGGLSSRGRFMVPTHALSRMKASLNLRWRREIRIKIKRRSGGSLRTGLTCVPPAGALIFGRAPAGFWSILLACDDSRSHAA